MSDYFTMPYSSSTEILIFFGLSVGLLTACPSGEFKFIDTDTASSSSSSSTVDPTQSGTEHCGNGVCDIDESTQLCPQDCPGCGDGKKIEPEVCDGGQDNSPDNAYHEGLPEDAPCNSTCTGKVQHCGDGTCHPQYDEHANSCDADCDPTCGNGVMEDGETCDDGNLLDGDACVDCIPAVCGDGVVQMGVEGCDDGNKVATDTCTDACKPAACRDGIVWFGMEECDDGNVANNDDCSDACKLPRTVFVTKASFLGNLGGLSGADAKCQTAAQAAGLTGNYKAWLSDGAMGPAQRLDTTFTGVYRLVDGSTVAVGWNDLTDGSLNQPISLQEEGMSSEGAAVWSNSEPSGTEVDANDCIGWTSNEATPLGNLGNSGMMNASWSNIGQKVACNIGCRLYCFQDP